MVPFLLKRMKAKRVLNHSKNYIVKIAHQSSEKYYFEELKFKVMDSEVYQPVV